MYAWNITATHDVYCLANILLPRLIVKFEDAQEIIDFLEKKYGKERLNG